MVFCEKYFCNPKRGHTRAGSPVESPCAVQDWTVRFPGRRPNCGKEGTTCNSNITEDLSQKQVVYISLWKVKAAPTSVSPYLSCTNIPAFNL